MLPKTFPPGRFLAPLSVTRVAGVARPSSFRRGGREPAPRRADERGGGGAARPQYPVQVTVVEVSCRHALLQDHRLEAHPAVLENKRNARHAGAKKKNSENKSRQLKSRF